MDFSDEESDSTSFIEKSELQMHRQHQHDRRKRKFWLATLCFAVAAASSCGTVITERLFQWLSRPTHASGLSIQYDPVGAFLVCPDTSSEAARKAGCKFDILGMGWVPPPCFDQELYTQATEGVLSGAVPDFGYYSNSNGSGQVPMSEIMRYGEYERYPELYLSTESHYQHCHYLINGTIRRYSTMDDAYMDGMLNAAHMQHCFGVLTDEDERRANARYPPYPPIEMGAAFWMPRRCYLKQYFPSGRDLHVDVGYFGKPIGGKTQRPRQASIFLSSLFSRRATSCTLYLFCKNWFGIGHVPCSGLTNKSRLTRLTLRIALSGKTITTRSFIYRYSFIASSTNFCRLLPRHKLKRSRL